MECEHLSGEGCVIMDWPPEIATAKSGSFTRHFITFAKIGMDVVQSASIEGLVLLWKECI